MVEPGHDRHRAGRPPLPSGTLRRAGEPRLSGAGPWPGSQPCLGSGSGSWPAALASLDPTVEKKELGPSSSEQGGDFGAALQSLSFRKDGSSPRQGRAAVSGGIWGCQSQLGD